MRLVTYAINISLDGCCDHTKFGPGDDDELMEYFTRFFDDIDLVVYGRKTYELMFPYWANVAKDPSATKTDTDFARAITAVDKVVFSRTLAKADENTSFIRTDPAGELMKLKQQPGKKISIGSVSLLPQLMALGLIDEYRLVVHPIVVGEGRRVFENTSFPENLPLKLSGTKVFKSGCVGLHYLKK